MNDLELEKMLRDAGARLRDTAPSTEATETALAGLHDVRLDEPPPARRRLWIIAPAVLAAAAVTLGVLVVNPPADETIRPSETTAVPTPTTVAPAPTTVPAPVTVPSTVPSTVAPTTTAPPTTTTVRGEVELIANTRLRTTEVDFDGDGGACLTVVKTDGTEVARGCATGSQMRDTSRGLRFRVDEVPVTLFPTGRDGSRQPELVVAASAPCKPQDVPGRMVEDAGCLSDGAGVVGILPATAVDAVDWRVTRAEEAAAGTAVDLVAGSDAVGGRVFRTPEAADVPPCLIVTTRGQVVGEACSLVGAQSFLAGTADVPLIVEHDETRGTTQLTALDPATPLAASGCPDLAVGAVLGLLPATGTVSALLCAADAGVAIRPPGHWLDRRSEVSTVEVLARDAGGQWSIAQRGPELTCRELPAICTGLNVTDLGGVLSFPSAATIAAFDEALGGGVALTSRNAIDVVGDLPTARTVTQMADGLAVLLRDLADPEQQVDVIGEGTPIVIRQTNLDDSVTATVYVIDTGPLPDDASVIRVTHIRAFDVCGRGLSTLDGQAVCL